MRRNEEHLARRIERRLGSSRASVYFEFAVLMPFVMFLMFFAVDFTRILRTEQQCEIATRALADVESHVVVAGASETPHSKAKLVVRDYLADVLGTDQNRVFCRATWERQKGPAHAIVNTIHDVLHFETGSKILNILLKFFSTAVDVFTMRAYLYFTEVFQTDRVLRANVSAWIPTLIPGGFYNHFGRDTAPKDWLLVVPYENCQDESTFALDRKMYTDRRKRAYCTMPIMDTAPLAQPTYTRLLKQKFKQWLK